jgi:hypothetical protein
MAGLGYEGFLSVVIDYAAASASWRASAGFSCFLQIQHLTPILPATVSASANP